MSENIKLEKTNHECYLCNENDEEYIEHLCHQDSDGIVIPCVAYKIIGNIKYQLPKSVAIGSKLVFDPAKPVQTRGGRKARIICTDSKFNLDKKFPIVALIECNTYGERLEYFNIDGCSYRYRDSQNDLVNVPEDEHTGKALNPKFHKECINALEMGARAQAIMALNDRFETAFDEERPSGLKPIIEVMEAKIAVLENNNEIVKECLTALDKDLAREFSAVSNENDDRLRHLEIQIGKINEILSTLQKVSSTDCQPTQKKWNPVCEKCENNSSDCHCDETNVRSSETPMLKVDKKYYSKKSGIEFLIYNFNLCNRFEGISIDPHICRSHCQFNKEGSQILPCGNSYDLDLSTEHD